MTVTMDAEPSVLRQYRMTVRNHDRIVAAAREEGVTIVEWMTAHFNLYFAEVAAIEAKEREQEARRQERQSQRTPRNARTYSPRTRQLARA